MVRTDSSSSEVMVDTKVIMTAVMLLQGLTNGVMDTTTPYHRLRGRSEVVIYENDVRSLLNNPSISNTCGKPDIGGLEAGWRRSQEPEGSPLTDIQIW